MIQIDQNGAYIHNHDLEGWEDGEDGETDSGNDIDCWSGLDSESENSDDVGM